MGNGSYLEMKKITKEFPGVRALNQVDFSMDLGKVTALVGENGAGKSTLIKVLAGIHRCDSGEIYIDGKLKRIDNPNTAKSCGISVIHQELNVLDNLSITENIFIGQETRRGLFLNKGSMREYTSELLGTVGLNVDPGTLVRYLSTAQKQMVEIARALAWQAKIIVMDEPTSSLTQKETEILFEIVDNLRKDNVGIVYISHRMDEIMRLADNVVVLRDGELVGTLDGEDIQQDAIIRMMVGRELDELFPKLPAEIKEPVLRVENLKLGHIKDITFEVHAGEILGFSGLVGAGRSEVMRMVFGIDKKETGTIYMDGKQVSIRTPIDAIRHGIALVPEDRKTQALVLHMSIRENTTLPILSRLRKRLFFNKKREREITQEYMQSLSIVAPSMEQTVKNLSGGNQQKVVLAKWMASNPRVLILDEPTRGIDVGAKREIHELVSKMAQQGVAVIMISSELPEVLGMSDRIIVMHEGRIKGELMRNEASQERIMQMAIS